MGQDVGETGEASRLELWCRASLYGDLEAWAAFQQSLEETVLTWFHAHPSCEAASRVQSESHFVARAFEQLWHLVVQGQVACETLSEALVYLRASLNGVILETLRASRRPGTASSPGLDGGEHPESSMVWDSLQAVLPNRRERRLAYLLYHCGLEPPRLCEPVHRNGAMSARWLVCGALSWYDSYRTLSSSRQDRKGRSSQRLLPSAQKDGHE